MKGLLKAKPAGTQFLILISVALCSFFIPGMIGTVLLAKLSGMSLEQLSDSSKWDYSDEKLIMVIRGMQVIQFIFLFLIPSYICSRMFSNQPGRYLGLKTRTTAFFFFVAAALLIFAIPLTNLLGHLNQSIEIPGRIGRWMHEQEDEANRTIKGLLSKRSIADLVINIICIAGLAAVGEELLFRGMAQRILIKLFRSPWPGIIIAAFLFSAMHVQFFGFFPRFVLGILLGAAYWYSGSLWVAILAHFVYDAFLIVLVYLNPGKINEDNAISISNLALAGMASLAVVTALMIWMKQRSKTTYADVYAEDIAAKNHPFDFEGRIPE